MSGKRSGATSSRQWSQAFRLAWQDFAHEWPISLCLVLAMSAVLAPLLVLFGLKSGIVSTLVARLRSDPANREIVIRGNHNLGVDWFATLTARPDVGFVVPRTRTLAATITLESGTGRQLQDVDMIPTRPGDPLVPAAVPMPEGLGPVLLTATAAGRLDAQRGDALSGLVSRRLEGEPQGVRVPLVVAGVLPEAAFGRDAVFVPGALLVATEDYRDGHRVPELGVEDGAARTGPRLFANARLYARDIDDVATLAGVLRDQELDVRTRAREIETVRAIDRVLTLVFLVLATLAGGGLLLSLASSLWANVDRKRRELAFLRLIGLRTGPVVAFPAGQAVLVSLGACALSGLLYLGVAALFNEVFASELGREEFVCRLNPRDGAAAMAATIAFSIVASLLGGTRAARIDPAESLREP